jgi:hypothetical protein
MQQIQYERGVFRTYRALTKVAFGKAEADVFKDDTIDYDGYTLRIAGKEVPDPAVRGAINAGWLVPVEDNVSQYLAKKSDIRLRPALNAGAKADLESSLVELQDEEREVGSVDDSNAKRKGAIAATQQRVAAPADDGSELAALRRQNQEMQAKLDRLTRAQEPTGASPKAFMGGKVVSDEDYQDSSGQGAVPVATFKTAAVQNFVTSEDNLRKMSQNLQADGRPLAVEPRKVAASVRLTRESATGDVMESREALDVADLLPDAAKGIPKGPSGVVNTEGEDKYPSTTVFLKDGHGNQFPWDKSHHWKVRIKTALTKYGEDTVALKAIIAVEDAGVVKELRKAVGE